MTCTAPCKWCEKDALRDAVVDAARAWVARLDDGETYYSPEMLAVEDAVRALDERTGQ